MNPRLLVTLFIISLLLQALPCFAVENSTAILVAVGSDNDSADNEMLNGNTINPFGRFLRSALIPGWGEISLDSKSGFGFLGVEILLWAGRFYYLEEVKLYERDSYLYALNNAGLKPGNYSDEFLHKLTRYNSSGFGPGGYNEYIFRQAQGLYPDDADQQNQYILENAIMDEELFWEWGDRDQRRQYSIKRKNADHNRDYVKFVAGAIVANHIISAINSMRIANQTNRLHNLGVSVDISRPDTPMAVIHYSFK